MFMTITEIASGLYRKNATVMEYSMALAMYNKLDAEQQKDVRQIGFKNYVPTAKAA